MNGQFIQGESYGSARGFFPGGGFGPGGGFFPGGGFPGFFPGGGFGRPPFFHPFFPRRRFFPFFFLSPFFFPFFFRGEEDRDGMYSMQHQCKGGETFGSLAQMYNSPQPILEAMNPHIQNPHALAAGTMVNIPRLDKMYCHKMYLEQEMPENVSQAPMAQMPNMPNMGQMTQAASPYTGTTYPMNSGQ